VAAACFGLNVADVLEVVRAGIGGEVVSMIIDGFRRYEVVVRFDEVFRWDVVDIFRIPVRILEGNIVLFLRVAEVVVMSGVVKVRRESLLFDDDDLAGPALVKHGIGIARYLIQADLMLHEFIFLVLHQVGIVPCVRRSIALLCVARRSFVPHSAS